MADYNEYRPAAREPSFIQTVTPNAIRRSITRASGYSHDASASASTRSWVYSTQQNPPPPPVDANIVRTPRPLPDPHRYSQTPQTLHAINADPPEEEEEEEEYMNIDPGGPGLEFGYQTEGLGRGRRMSVSSPIYHEDSGSGGKSFVGGFVKGLKRFPKAVFRYGGKGRRATAGTEGTITSGGMTGSTLPRYVSNPPTPIAGPSNVQFVQATEMPVPPIPEGANPASTIGHSSGSRRRHNPSFRVTPPSDILNHGDVAQTYGFPQPSPPQFNVNPSGISRLNSQRATVMTYQDTAAGTISLDHTTQAHDPHLSLASHASHPGVSHSPNIHTPVQSPPVVAAHPLPANDYMKMSLSPGHANRTTMTTITSYEPSFSSELSPVERFFHVLYHLPWVAHERVTVDYRPGIGSGGQSGGRGVVKKALASWYKGVASGAANADIDLLSSGGGTGSRRTSGATNQTPVVSPTTGKARVRRSSSQQQRSSQPRHHHRKHRRRATVSTMNTAQEIQHQRNNSPLIPAVYPFQYPPYPYSYPAYPPPAETAPQGSRSHRSRTYPRGGYAPYQPMPPPPPPTAPVYVLHSSPARTSGGDVTHSPQVAQGQLLSPVYMQLIPGAFNGQEGVGLTSSPSSPAPVRASDPAARSS